MKRILVMCKDREQWVGFQDRMVYNVARSLLTRIELRTDSIILQEEEGDSTFLMFTPSTRTKDLATGVLFDSIKWLCDEREFDKQIVDYLKERIVDE